jgi:anti-anti-sigma factor
MIKSPVNQAHTAPSHECQLVTEQLGPVRVVKVVGHLDWTTAGSFIRLVCDECRGPALVVDLLGTESIDSAGTAGLVVSTRTAKERGQRIVVVTTDPLVLDVFDSAGLSAIVPVFASTADAMNWLTARDLTTAGWTAQ